jgi:hypothetical protein
VFEGIGRQFASNVFESIGRQVLAGVARPIVAETFRPIRQAARRELARRALTAARARGASVQRWMKRIFAHSAPIVPPVPKVAHLAPPSSRAESPPDDPPGAVLVATLTAAPVAPPAVSRDGRSLVTTPPLGKARPLA